MIAQWVDPLNAAAAGWTAAMWRASWQGGLALLAAWGIGTLLARGNGRVASWLWRLGYLKFIACMLLVVPLALPLLPRQSAPVVTAPQVALIPAAEKPAAIGNNTHSDAPPIANQLDAPSPLEASSTPLSPAPQESPPSPAIAPAPKPSLPAWLMFLWSIGLSIGVLRLLVAWRRTRLMLKDALPVHDATIRETAARAARNLNIESLPRLLATQSPAGPLLTGLLRPAIVLPAGLLENCPPAQLELIFAHELAHLKRRDLWWNWLQAAVSLLFFFHPLVWLASRPWRLAQELACDELALAAARAHPADYGRTLLDLLAQQSIARRRLVGVGVVGSHSTLRRRIIAMKNLPPRTRRRLALAAACTAFAGMIGIVPWRLAAQTPGSQLLSSGSTAVATQDAGPLLPPGNMATAQSSTANTTPGGANGQIHQRPPKDQFPDVLVKDQPTDVQDYDKFLLDKKRAPVFTGTDPSKIENSDKVITQIIPLVNVDVARLRQDLDPLLSADSDVAVNQTSNCLIITDTSAKVRRIVEIVSMLDHQAKDRVPPAPPGAMPLPVVTPVAESPQHTEGIAVLSAPKAEMRSPAAGVLTEVHAAEGQHVKKGDILFKFDSREDESRVQVDQAHLDLAQGKLARAEITAGTTPEEAKAEVAADKAVLAADVAKFDANNVRAPFDGVLTGGDWHAGQFVSQGDLLTTVVDTTDLRVDVMMVTALAAKYKSGQKITFTPMDQKLEVAGEISSISPVADAATGTVAVHCRITGPIDSLKPGMYGEVKIQN